MKFSNRLFLYGPFGLVVALGLAVSIHWWIEAGAWGARIAALNNREIAPGVTLHYKTSKVGGFPFRYDTVFTGFRLSLAGPRALSWSAAEFAMHRLSYGSSKYVFEAGGKQTLSWKDGQGAPRQFSFLPGSIRADAVIAEGRLARFDMVLVAFDSVPVTAARIETHLRHDPLADALQAVTFAQALATEKGAKPTDPRITVSVTAAKALSGLLSGQQDWRAAAELWRKAGGEIRLTSPNAEGIDVSGTVGLDPSHRLTGALPPSFADTGTKRAPLY
jgi:hypothetical protein